MGTCSWTSPAPPAFSVLPWMSLGGCAGKSKKTPCAVVQDASLVTQKTVSGTLEDITLKVRRHGIKPPAIVIIGKVAELRKKLKGLNKNRRVLFTGLSKERFFAEESFFHLPLIKILPLEDYSEFDSILKGIRKFDWIVFASRYGVKYFFERLKIAGHDSRVLNNIKI